MDNGTTRLFLRCASKKELRGEKLRLTSRAYTHSRVAINVVRNAPHHRKIMAKTRSKFFTNLPRVFYPHGVTFSGLYRLVLLLRSGSLGTLRSAMRDSYSPNKRKILLVRKINF